MDEREVVVACRTHCENCRARQRRYLTGLCWAESYSADSVTLLTLTFGGGVANPDASRLTRSHAQNFFKRLRKRGFRFRYMGAGEYGERVGRAHWHFLVFWEGPEPPELAYQTERWTWAYTDKRGENREVWPHGFTYAERPRDIGASGVYIVKYIEKGHAQMRSHGLGARYLEDYARDIARKGGPLFPMVTWPSFTVPTSVVRKGKTAGTLWRYELKPDSALFQQTVLAYLDEWQRHRRDKPPRWSGYLREYAEDLALQLDSPRSNITPIRNNPEWARGIAEMLSDWGVNVCLTADEAPDQRYTTLGSNLQLVEIGEHKEVRTVTDDGESKWRKVVDAEVIDAIKERHERARLERNKLAPLPIGSDEETSFWNWASARANDYASQELNEQQLQQLQQVAHDWLDGREPPNRFTGPQEKSGNRTQHDPKSVRRLPRGPQPVSHGQEETDEGRVQGELTFHGAVSPEGKE
jgi:hypothetical protein